MKKTVVIHQPDFLPYLGFFHRLLNVDQYLVLDDVQFVKSNNSWTHRDKIKSRNGEQWLTISVNKSSRDTKINEVILNNDIKWRENNLNLIQENYKKADYFDQIFPYIKKLYGYQCSHLWEFNMASIQMLLDLFDIKIEMIFSSTLKSTKNKSERIVELLQQVNATDYLSGVGAKDYHDQKPFDKANINVAWQEFSHPVYKQLYGDFIPYLSSIDLLFNCGIERSREILRSC